MGDNARPKTINFMGIDINIGDYVPRETEAQEDKQRDLEIFVDASCFPNPGGKMFGGLYMTYKRKKLASQGQIFLGDNGTNNSAEIRILTHALNVLKKVQAEHPEYANAPCRLVSDSLLIVSAIQREGAKNADLNEEVMKFIEIRDGMANPPDVIWVSRKKNAFADALSRPKE